MSSTEFANNNCPQAIEASPSGSFLQTRAVAGYGFVAGTVEDGRSFMAYSSEDQYLYCIADNSGVRIGIPENTTATIFTMTDNYLYNMAQARFLGVYRTYQNWRCYKNINTNISGQVIEFWKAE